MRTDIPGGRTGDQGLLSRCAQVSPCRGRGTVSSRCRLRGGCCTWDRRGRPRRERTPVSAATWQEAAVSTSCWRCMVSRAGTPAPGGSGRKGGPPGTLGGRAPPSTVPAKTRSDRENSFAFPLDSWGFTPAPPNRPLPARDLRARSRERGARTPSSPRGPPRNKYVLRRWETQTWKTSGGFLHVTGTRVHTLVPERGDETPQPRKRRSRN